MNGEGPGGGVRLEAVDEAVPAAKWQALWNARAEGYRAWFLTEGDGARPPLPACAAALDRHMPELVPLWERLVELAGGDEITARLLSLYRPTPYLVGCSQAVWNRSPPLLVRNYDYDPALWDAVLLRSRWLRPVVAMTDILWGALDGINDAGLAASLAFGGRRVVGDGFASPLIVRYLLETCETAAEAGEVLARVPSHMSYNVTVIDRTGAYLTAYVAPDRPTVLTRRRAATNHQGAVEWHEHAVATGSVDRERFLRSRLGDESETAERLASRFLEPPLHSARFEHGWGTLYTAVYHPPERTMELRWPGGVGLRQGVEAFGEGNVRLRYGAAALV